MSAITVDETLDELVSGKTAAVLRTHHPLVQQILQATDINVVQSSGKSRCLLIEIEQRGDSGPLWLSAGGVLGLAIRVTDEARVWPLPLRGHHHRRQRHSVRI